MRALHSTLPFTTIRYDEKKNEVVILDQTKLPEKENYLRLKTVNDVYRAIRNMNVRGAPLIGVTAAYGVVLAARNSVKEIIRAANYLKSARPTAVNLSWAIERMKSKITSQKNVVKVLLQEARAIEQEDKTSCLEIGRHGEKLIRQNARVMVHCNAGALATSGIGTALGVLYTAQAHGTRFTVYSCETRPLLQGARLTSWELTKHGIETFTICDNMAATYMPGIDCVLVGADRIARNGDTANKIGTCGLAIIARHYCVPFYVVAPLSTFDCAISSGAAIPIETRCDAEVRTFNKKHIVAHKAKICNPAFDVTRADLITGIVTEKGVLKPPYRTTIDRLCRKAR